MKLISYQSERGPRVAVALSEGIVDVQDADSRLPSDMLSLLAGGSDALAQAQQAAVAAPAEARLAVDAVKLLAPIPRPGKVICVGLNYKDHAKETGREPPEEPVIFNKFPTAVIAPGEAIELPPQSEKVDYEAELVVVIGRTAKNVGEAEALNYVAGYCCGHDVSARDWQVGKPGGQWLLGKTFDTFAPLGPYLVTADEVGDPGQLTITFRLNGETLQDSHTSELIYPVPHLISYLSAVTTLEPGDCIFTGTPAGVGVARQPRVFLKPGDTAEVEIQKLGVLQNPVIARP